MSSGSCDHSGASGSSPVMRGEEAADGDQRQAIDAREAMLGPGVAQQHGRNLSSGDQPQSVIGKAIVHRHERHAGPCRPEQRDGQRRRRLGGVHHALDPEPLELRRGPTRKIVQMLVRQPVGSLAERESIGGRPSGHLQQEHDVHRTLINLDRSMMFIGTLISLGRSVRHRSGSRRR